MDKYQLNLLNRGKITFESEMGTEKIELGDKLTVYQNENYNIGGYKIIFSNPSIEKIKYQSKTYLNKDNNLTIEYDFTSGEIDIVISFKNELADDCALKIFPVIADKDKFDKELDRKNQMLLESATALSVKNGPSLINVFWKKANENVDKCVLKIYYKSETGINYLVYENEVCGEYLSLTGLVTGRYYVYLDEFDHNKLLISLMQNTYVVKHD